MGVLFDRKVEQMLIGSIAIVVSSPHEELDREKAREYYARMNHPWDSGHEIQVLRTARTMTEMDAFVTAAIALCIENQPVPAQHTLIVQPLRGAKANFCFCTYLASKNWSADDSLIAVWEGPIPYVG